MMQEAINRGWGPDRYFMKPWLVIVGPTQSGKSTIVGLLAEEGEARPEVGTASRRGSVTTEPKVYKTILNNKFLVDCPGYDDSRLRFTDEQCGQMIAEALLETHHLMFADIDKRVIFLVVDSLNGNSLRLIPTLDWLKRSFGDEGLASTVVLATRADEVQEEVMEDRLNEVREAVQEFLGPDNPTCQVVRWQSKESEQLLTPNHPIVKRQLSELERILTDMQGAKIRAFQGLDRRVLVETVKALTQERDEQTRVRQHVEHDEAHRIHVEPGADGPARTAGTAAPAGNAEASAAVPEAARHSGPEGDVEVPERTSPAAAAAPPPPAAGGAIATENDTLPAALRAAYARIAEVAAEIDGAVYNAVKEATRRPEMRMLHGTVVAVAAVGVGLPVFGPAAPLFAGVNSLALSIIFDTSGFDELIHSVSSFVESARRTVLQEMRASRRGVPAARAAG
mmetsp:Transcript_82058/g.171766  ORF Transcript_82058/g.171766 Transcript_82058/m.171766 type:complete len:452 (-) Transcript_82058:316-1671(-)